MISVTKGIYSGRELRCMKKYLELAIPSVKYIIAILIVINIPFSLYRNISVFLAA